MVHGTIATRLATPEHATATSGAARLAKGVLALDAEIAELYALIAARLHDHSHANAIESLPGMGPRLGADFIAATGGDLAAFGTPDRLAGFAGLAPAPAIPAASAEICVDPAAITAACYLAAMASLRCCPVSQRYYQRKRD